jgi:peptidase E
MNEAPVIGCSAGAIIMNELKEILLVHPIINPPCKTILSDFIIKFKNGAI